MPAPPDASQSEHEKSSSRFRWKPPDKALLGIGVFAILSTGILFITHMFGSMYGHDMGGHDMGGMDHGMNGHNMGGMSHDNMMRVDGAFNATPVTVEAV